jgi:hypothetical protein
MSSTRAREDAQGLKANRSLLFGNGPIPIDDNVSFAIGLVMLVVLLPLVGLVG